MGVPKIIHYCWFGNGEIPKKEMECISSWQESFPGYEFKFWNEENFDYSSCNFARQAYEEKKYAFVSDYARAKLLYEYGGLYLDTDVKILKSFTDLLYKYDGLLGFERKAFIGTAVIACKPRNESIGKLLEYYEKHNFIQKDGSFDNIANVSIITDILRDSGLVLGGKEQIVGPFLVTQRELFYPKKISENSFKITSETRAVHMCSNSWLSERERKRGNNIFWIKIVRPLLRKFREVGIKLFGKEMIRSFEIKLRNKLR